jgi:hypothetical protein
MPGQLAPLIIEPLDRDSLEADIAVALVLQSTRVFLDTSTLVWLYRLHDAARKEFVDWIVNGPQSGRVHIPRRVLHEFSRYRRDAAVLLPFKQQLKALPALLQQLDQWAHLITDDARAKAFGFESRAKYLSDVGDLSKSAVRLLKPINAASDLEKLDAELTPVFNDLALDADIYMDITDLQRAYEARAEARMPPGFKDVKKIKKSIEAEPVYEDETAGIPELAGANRFGDYVIWEEILRFCALQEDIETVIILTHDQKPDWSYTPQKIIDNDGHTKPNPKGPFRVTVAHPLLAHEARVRASVENLYIITVPQLALVASRRRLSLSLAELSRAVQVEAEATLDAAEADEVQEGAEPATEAREVEATTVEMQPAEELATQRAAAGDIVEFLRDLPQEASADRLYTRDPTGAQAMDQVVTRLKSLNWYTQNPAATEGLQLLRQGSPSLLQAFIYGRNIYQAACGSATIPVSIIEHLPDELAQVNDDLAIGMYAGALFEAYFNKDGEIRSRPKSERITELFTFQDTVRFRPAIDAIRQRLD